MADEPEAGKLREMAEHRGLKLLKSRRRKPGTGDFGKFGLTDASGTALLGIGEDGLTASAADIATWLRDGTLGTWAKSAGTLPDRPVAKPKPLPSQPAKTTSPAKAKPRAKADSPRPPPPPKPAPQLTIRPVTPADIDAVAILISRPGGTAIDSAKLRKNLTAITKAGGGMIVADRGKPIGCCGWTIVQTIEHGPIGRITVIVVADGHRRRGIARKLLDTAERALATAGCTMVEAMSDIRIDNAHNFFRALKFEQASYRFTRKPGN